MQTRTIYEAKRLSVEDDGDSVYAVVGNDWGWEGCWLSYGEARDLANALLEYVDRKETPGE